MSQGPTEVGSIIGYLILDDSNWDRTIDRAERKADDLAKHNPKIEIKAEGRQALEMMQAVLNGEDRLHDEKIKVEVDAGKAIRDLAEVRGAESLLDQWLDVHVDVDANNAVPELAQIAQGLDQVADAAENVETATVNANQKGLRPLLSLAVLLGPALIPSAVGATAALGGLALGAASAAVGLLGIKNEMDAGTNAGVQYTAGLKTLVDGWGQLKTVGAQGLLDPFLMGVSDAKVLLPELVDEVHQFSGATGDAAVHLTNGLVKGFLVLRPLLSDVINGTGRLAVKFDEWTSHTGGITKFMAYAQAVGPLVAKTFGELALAAIHVGAALSQSGVLGLTAIGALARVINSIPVDQLTHVTTAAILLFAAFKAYQIVLLAAAAFGKATGAAQTFTLWTQRATVASAAQAASLAAANARLAANAAAKAGAADAALLLVAADRAAATAATANAGAQRAAGLSMATALGPIGALAAGLGILAFAFFGFGSSGPSKAKQAVDDFTQALIESKNVADATVKGKVLDELGDAALRNAQKLGIAGASLVEGITAGGPQLDTLRSQLEAIFEAGTKREIVGNPEGRHRVIVSYTDEAKAAKSLLGNLDTLSTSYDKSTDAAGRQLTAQDALAQSTKNLEDRIADVNDSFGVSEQTGQQYAQTVGWIAKSNLDAAWNAKRYAIAVGNVKAVEDSANTSTAALLQAMTTYSQSAATAMDKTALLGAVLKASQGDGLSFTAAMSGGRTAIDNLIKGFDPAQRAAILFKDSQRKVGAAIFDLKAGSIDFTQAGAAPLTASLQAMQDAALAAAQGVYQHEVGIKGDKQALAEAQAVFQQMTNGTLVKNATQLGLTGAQAKLLADRYFAISDKDLTARVQAIGLSDINTTLQQIGLQLSYLTNHKWVFDVSANVSGATAAALASTYRSQVPQFTATGASSTYNSQVPHRAGGGALDEGWTIFNEESAAGAESAHKVGNQVMIYSAAQTRSMFGGGGVAGPGIGSPAAKSVGASYSTPAAGQSQPTVVHLTSVTQIDGRTITTTVDEYHLRDAR